MAEVVAEEMAHEVRGACVVLHPIVHGKSTAHGYILHFAMCAVPQSTTMAEVVAEDMAHEDAQVVPKNLFWNQINVLLLLISSSRLAIGSNNNNSNNNIFMYRTM